MHVIKELDEIFTHISRILDIIVKENTAKLMTEKTVKMTVAESILYLGKMLVENLHLISIQSRNNSLLLRRQADGLLRRQIPLDGIQNLINIIQVILITASESEAGRNPCFIHTVAYQGDSTVFTNLNGFNKITGYKLVNIYND